MNVAKLKFVTKRGTLNDATTNVVRLTPKGTMYIGATGIPKRLAGSKT